MNNAFITSALFWKGFLFKLVIDSIVIVALAMAAALGGVNNWGELGTTQKIIVICGVIGVAGKNISSLLDKTFANKVAEQEDSSNLNAPAPLATKSELAVDKPDATAKP